MGSRTTKARNNIYTQARERAAKYNDALRSREGAAEQLGISTSSLADYELGLTKIMQPDKVVMMADLYNAQHLLYNYCSSECPIGQIIASEVEINTLDRVTIKLLNALTDTDSISEAMLEIVADGEIDAQEEDKLDEIIERLEQLGQMAKELKVWKGDRQ